MRKLVLTYFILIISIPLLFAQNVDSLMQVFKTSDIADTTRLEIFKKISRELVRQDPKSAYECSLKAISLSVKQNDKYAEIDNRILFGIINKKIGNYEKAIQSYFSALKIAKQINEQGLESVCLNNIGNIYQEQNNYDKALDFFKQSLKIEESLGNKSQISLRYYNIGAAYELKDSLDKAYSYYLNSLLIEQEINNKEGVYFAYYGLAGVERNRNKLDRSLEYLQKALNIATDLEDRSGRAICFNEIAKTYTLMEQPDSGIYYFEKSNEIAKEIQYQTIIKDNSYELSKIYASVDNFKQAYHFQTIFLEINDSINNVDINSRIAEIETKYELDNKEREINFLELESKSQKRYKNYLLLASIFLMLLSLTNLARVVENWYDIPIYSSLTLLLVFIISWILSYYREGASQISFNSILDSGFDVVSISILPIFGFILVYERLMLNTRLKTAKSLSQTISKIKQNDIVPDVSFLAENNKDVFRLKLNQLLFIEANDNYSSFSYLEKGQVKKELIRGSLKRMQEQIDNEALIRCHKSYIVNLNKINKVLGNAKGYRLQLDEVDIEIPVSRSFPKSIIEKIKSKH